MIIDLKNNLVSLYTSSYKKFMERKNGKIIRCSITIYNIHLFIKNYLKPKSYKHHIK